MLVQQIESFVRVTRRGKQAKLEYDHQETSILTRNLVSSSTLPPRNSAVRAMTFIKTCAGRQLATVTYAYMTEVNLRSISKTVWGSGPQPLLTVWAIWIRTPVFTMVRARSCVAMTTGSFSPGNSSSSKIIKARDSNNNNTQKGLPVHSEIHKILKIAQHWTK